ARNLISGNLGNGVEFYNSGGNVVAGNFIGTDKNGTAVVANLANGVSIGGGATGNRIGITFDGVAAGNLISGNGQSSTYTDGVVLWGAGTTGNLVAGNRIGTDVTGTVVLGNGWDGVGLVSGASGNTIG